MKRCAKIQPGIKEQRGDDSLQRIHQQSNFVAAAASFFAFSQPKVSSDPQLSCRPKQVACANQVRAQLGEFSLLIFRKALEKFPAHHETQHCIP